LRVMRDAVPTIAANFAAKEAFSKALGTGVRGFLLAEVSVLRNELGAPYLALSGQDDKWSFAGRLAPQLFSMVYTPPGLGLPAEPVVSFT